MMTKQHEDWRIVVGVVLFIILMFAVVRPW